MPLLPPSFSDRRGSARQHCSPSGGGAAGHHQVCLALPLPCVLPDALPACGRAGPCMPEKGVWMGHGHTGGTPHHGPPHHGGRPDQCHHLQQPQRQWWGPRQKPPIHTPWGYCMSRRGRDASQGKGPHRRPQRRLDRRLEEVAKAVGGGYCRLQMPLRPALGVRGTVAGRRLGALEGGGCLSPPSNASLRSGMLVRGGAETDGRCLIHIFSIPSLPPSLFLPAPKRQTDRQRDRERETDEVNLQNSVWQRDGHPPPLGTKALRWIPHCTPLPPPSLSGTPPTWQPGCLSHGSKHSPSESTGARRAKFPPNFPQVAPPISPFLLSRCWGPPRRPG